MLTSPFVDTCTLASNSSSLQKPGKNISFKCNFICAQLASKGSMGIKIRQITRSRLAIRQKLAASGIICVWTYEKVGLSYLTPARVENLYVVQIWQIIGKQVKLFVFLIIYTTDVHNAHSLRPPFQNPTVQAKQNTYF